MLYNEGWMTQVDKHENVFYEEDNHMDNKPIREIISTVFKALTLAMGVAVVVLSCLGSLEMETAVTLLGIGLTCAGIALLEKQ